METIPGFFTALSDQTLWIALVVLVLLEILTTALVFIFRAKARGADLRLEEKEEYYRTLFDANRDAIWDWRMDSNRDVFTSRFAEMLHYDPDEIGKSFSDWEKLIHPEDRKLADEALRMHFEGKSAYYSHEHRFRAKNGQWIWILGRGKVIEWSPERKPVRMIGTYTDVTDRYQTDEMVQLIIQTTASLTGSGYFQRLVLELWNVLRVRRISIGQRTGGPASDYIQTVSVCQDGKLISNYGYHLSGTPGGQLIDGHAVVIPDRILGSYPEDPDLAAMGARGYIGLPLCGPDGHILGNIVAESDCLLINPQLVENVLNIFTGRAAVELDHLRVKSELQDSESLWNFALEGSGDGIWDWDLVTNGVTFSETYQNMLGYANGEIPARLEAWMNLVHPEDLSQVLQEHQRHLRGETEMVYEEYRLKCKDGYYKWILGRGKVIKKSSDGKPLRLVSIHTDITLRKASEQIQHETMAKYQSLFASMTEGFAYHRLVLDENGKAVDYILLDVNPSFSTQLSIPREVAIGARGSSLYGTGTAPFLDVFSRVAMTGQPERLEIYFAPMDKHFDIAVFSPERGKFATVFMDVSERKIAEATIAKERNLLRTLLDNLPDAVYVKDLSFRKILANKADVTNAGLGNDAQVLGKTDFEVWPNELAVRFHEHDRHVIETGHPLINREELISPSGQFPRWILTSKIPLFGQDGKISGLIGIGKDITDLKLADREIRRLNTELEQRVVERTAQLEAVIEELEAFSYSVSHDLRAPLRALDGFSLTLMEDFGDTLGETGRNYLGRIRNASQRMSKLIDDLLKLSRISRSELHRGVVDLSDMAFAVSADLQASESSRVVDWDIQTKVMGNGDANFLHIVLVNLLGNSWKFTSRHTTARIQFGEVQKDGQRVYFVKDDGAGFDLAYAVKLFGPFQRMHSANEFEGTGIGLATVQRVIHRHGGKVWAESAVEQGTTVFFTLGNQE